MQNPIERDRLSSVLAVAGSTAVLEGGCALEPAGSPRSADSTTQPAASAATSALAMARGPWTPFSLVMVVLASRDARQLDESTGASQKRTGASRAPGAVCLEGR